MMSTRSRGLCREDDGAIVLVGVFFAVLLVGFLYYVVGVGETILYRERLQDAADAGAFSAAVMHARGMNVIALINMVMAALMAILVALRVVQIVAGAVIAIAVALSTFTAGGSMSAVPPARYVMKLANEAHKVAKPGIFRALTVLRTASVAMRSAIPIAAQGKMLHVVMGHHRSTVQLPLTLPLYRPLPVEDDAFNVLCSRAGRHVGEIVAYPFELALGPAGKAFGGAIAGGVEAAAGALPRVFCGSGKGRLPEVSFSTTVAYPQPMGPKANECAEREDLSQERHTRLCERAREEHRRSMPDDRTGLCRHSGTGGQCDGYAQWLRMARVQCRPGARDFESFRWQEKRITLTYRWTPAGVLLPPERREGPPTVRESARPPCGESHAIYSAQWSTNPSEPVCEQTHGRPPRRAPKTMSSSWSTSYVEVTQMVSCTAEEQHKREVRDVVGTVASGKRNPQRMVPNVPLGDEVFQLRTIVLGKKRPSLGERGVSVAAWNEGETSVDVPVLTRLAVAQAEFLFDGEGWRNRTEWLWHMSWRARLRRVRLPEDGMAPLTRSSCPQSACKKPEGFGALLEGLNTLETLVVH